MPEKDNISRRKFLNTLGRSAVILGLGGVAVSLLRNTSRNEMVWQLDASKCIQCGRCATACVLSPSAVKCVHVYDMCGYCDLCGGYLRGDAKVINTGAENQLCPTSAIKRKYIEEPFFEYEIIKELCIGCGKCVKGCGSFGNGSLQLQVDHSICVNCNQCAIAKSCPADAFTRVPKSNPVLLNGYKPNKQ